MAGTVRVGKLGKIMRGSLDTDFVFECVCVCVVEFGLLSSVLQDADVAADADVGVSHVDVDDKVSPASLSIRFSWK